MMCPWSHQRPLIQPAGLQCFLNLCASGLAGGQCHAVIIASWSTPQDIACQVHQHPHNSLAAGQPHSLDSVHTAMPEMQQMTADSMLCQMPDEQQQQLPLRRSASLNYPLPLQVAESSMTCHTPVQQQRQLGSSLSGQTYQSTHPWRIASD